jgi:hypothetical protein
MGVGVVRNTTNGKCFVFAARDLPAVMNRNRAQLRYVGHSNKALQADWKALGEAAFVIEVLDTLPASDDPAYDPRDDLRALEAMWLEKLAPWEPAGYHRPRAQR